MQKCLKITVYILILLVASLTILWLQKQLQVHISYLRLWIEKILTVLRSEMVWAIGLGLIFGLISCPICGVPLTVYIAGGENSIKNAFWAMFSFTLGRFVVFVASGILAGLVGLAILQARFFNLLPFLFIMVGILMIILSLNLLKIANVFKNKKKPGIFSRLTPVFFSWINQKVFKMKYLLWGSILGVVCSLEGLGFVIPLWLNAIARANVGYAVLCMCLFGLGAFIPTAVMVICGWAGLHLPWRGIRDRILKSARLVGAMVLFITGSRYIWIGLVNAKALLVQI